MWVLITILIIFVCLGVFYFAVYRKKEILENLDDAPVVETKRSQPTALRARAVVQPKVPVPEVKKTSWKETGLSLETIELVEKAGYAFPTPVQAGAIPSVLEGHDLIVSAETGSGKTAGFCLPLIEKIRGRKGTLALILCPTREIAIQSHQVLLQFAQPQGINSICLIGGINIREEEKLLKEYPQIIVGTPGRLFDHQERGNIWFEYIETVVLDEADRMLEMGFSTQINAVMKEMTENRQTLLFSATIAGETENLAKKYLKNPKRIDIGVRLTVAPTIKQEVIWVNEDSKERELRSILSEKKGSIIVFLRTKVETGRLFESLYTRGFRDADFLSSEKLQKDREKTLKDFREGVSRILIATEVAGRGIHVDDVALVINYDFPISPEDYLHRVGRTGRKGEKGLAISFVTPKDRRLLEDVERSLGIKIPQSYSRDFSNRAPPDRNWKSRRPPQSKNRRPR